MDITKKNEQINEISIAANRKACENVIERWENATSVIRDGLKQFPNSWRLKKELIIYLSPPPPPPAPYNENKHLANLREVNDICEDIISNCPDLEIQHSAIFYLCAAAIKTGNTGRAAELTKNMPTMHECQEELRLMICDRVDERAQYIKENIINHALYLDDALYSLTNGQSCLYGYCTVQ